MNAQPDPFGFRSGAKVFLQERNLLDDNKCPARPEGARVHVIRDRFSLCPFPFIIYNAKFGVPYPANVPARLKIRNAPFQALTQFQLRTRGIALTRKQEKGFDRGDWICIVPAYGDEGQVGKPSSPISVMATNAFYAHCIRAQRVLQAARYREDRDRRPHERFEKEDLHRIGRVQLAELELVIEATTEKYKDPRVLEIERSIGAYHITTKGRSLVPRWFKRSQVGSNERPQIFILRQCLLEVYCYDQIHGYFDPDEICNRELQIVEVLRTAQLRAIACYRLQRIDAVSQLKKNHVIESKTASRLYDGVWETDLNIWGCFLAALHGGFNPAMLYRRWAEYADLFDIAAWLGYFGRGHDDLLGPEISESLLAILNLDVAALTVKDEDDVYLHQAYREIQRIAEVLVGTEELASAASLAFTKCEPIEVRPRLYSAVTMPAAAKMDHPRLQLDPRFKVAVTNDPTDLVIGTDRYLLAAAKEHLQKDEQLFIQRFLPLIW